MASPMLRRSARIPHTPKMSERKRALFQSKTSTKNTSKHRLPVVNSESDSDSCDLGIISALDSCSSDDAVDQSVPKTPNSWRDIQGKQHNTRSKTNINEFLKSPLTFKNYLTRQHDGQEKPASHSKSTPVTPHLRSQAYTPSGTHSSKSMLHSFSASDRVRKSLSCLIADTESCSSSLQDLNFDSDSSCETKENTPKKPPTNIVIMSDRKTRNASKNLKGVLVEQKSNSVESYTSPSKHHRDNIKNSTIVIKETLMLSPTHMLKTPHNTVDETMSPPKMSHHRRTIPDSDESPASVEHDINSQGHKRLRPDEFSEYGPETKSAKLDPQHVAPKARLSLFNSDKIKEFLSVKSFYPKQEVDLNSSHSSQGNTSSSKSTNNYRKVGYSTHSKGRRKKYGEINMGVRHRIRKPKYLKTKVAATKLLNAMKMNRPIVVANSQPLIKPQAIQRAQANTSMDLNVSNIVEDKDKTDPFATEHQKINELLSQWNEEEVPITESVYLKNSTPKTEPLMCFNQSVIEQTNTLFKPNEAVPVNPIFSTSLNAVESGKVLTNLDEDSSEEIRACRTQVISDTMNAEQTLLAIDGGFFVVDESSLEVDPPVDVEAADLDAIQLELDRLDEQIYNMATTNNINPDALLTPMNASNSTIPATDLPVPKILPTNDEMRQNITLANDTEIDVKLFPVFTKEAITQPAVKGKPETTKANKKSVLKSLDKQYVIDAGQKKFGATQCHECGSIYEIGNPQDEIDHLTHHNSLDVLRFNGWKEERVVGVWGTSRCVSVRKSSGLVDPHWRKVLELLERVVHPQLGYANALPSEDQQHRYTAYLYIEKKQIIGCLVAETRSSASKLIPGEVDCCTELEYPVKCGISRIWTHFSCRRRGVASRMLNAARASFLPGHILTLDEVAFSSPTPDGKQFALNYTGNPNFYVYL